MVARLTLTIAVVQRLKCKSKFKKELLTTGHDHGRIRNNTFDPLFLICSRLMGFASVLKVFVGVLNAKIVVDSCLNSRFAASFQVFSVVTSLGNKPAKTKHNGNIYKRIVKINTGVQSFCCWIKAFWATKSQIRQIGVCWCQFFQKHLKTIVLVNYHFLWSTPNKSVQQPQQPKINGRLKIPE